MKSGLKIQIVITKLINNNNNLLILPYILDWFLFLGYIHILFFKLV